MDALLVVTLSAAVVALVLGVVGWRGVGPAPLVAEAVMLVAMVDVHVPRLGLVPAGVWALLLGGCALVTAFVDRVRRGRGRTRPGGDHLHALGMLLGAAFILFAGAHGGGAGSAMHGAHVHALGAFVVPVLVAVVVHVTVVLRAVARGGVRRVEGIRRVAALVSLLAMGAMVTWG